MQKEATGSLPRFSLDTNILRQYFRSRRWLAGLAADFGGALLMIAAFALAPVSLVQPVSGVGLVSLAVYSHVWLKARQAQALEALLRHTPAPALAVLIPAVLSGEAGLSETAGVEETSQQLAGPQIQTRAARRSA